LINFPPIEYNNNYKIILW